MPVRSNSACLKFEVWVLLWFLCSKIVSGTSPGFDAISRKLGNH